MRGAGGEGPGTPVAAKNYAGGSQELGVKAE